MVSSDSQEINSWLKKILLTFHELIKFIMLGIFCYIKRILTSAVCVLYWIVQKVYYVQKTKRWAATPARGGGEAAQYWISVIWLERKVRRREKSPICKKRKTQRGCSRKKEGTNSHPSTKRFEDVHVHSRTLLFSCICTSSFLIHVEKPRSK